MDKLFKAYLGSKIADAVSMPVHWYYNRGAMDRDYDRLNTYRKPRQEHPDSIMWRSEYIPINDDADILHEQAMYWGRKGVHYHRELAAGENTLNFKLADELYRSVLIEGGYCPDVWLDRYIECMRTPGWHNDTYIEEYHREFFNNRARGMPLGKCASADSHIGGLAQIPALVASLQATGSFEVSKILDHVKLTHNHPDTLASAEIFARTLEQLGHGHGLREALEVEARSLIGVEKLEKLSKQPDRVIIGRLFSPACYLPASFTGSLVLVWKYHNDFERGIISNARCGGDNCHRGAVVGAMLGAVNDLPDKRLHGLKLIQGHKR